MALNISEREKKFLIFGGIAVVLILGFYFYTLYGDMKVKAKDYIDSRVLVLERQKRILAKKDVYQKKSEEIKKDLARLGASFLQGTKPPVAAAELQNLLKQIATSLGIEVKVEKALNPQDVGFYVAVPVEIGFMAKTGDLKELLERIMNAEPLLTVSELKVRVINVSKPDMLNVSVVVTGFIRKEGPQAEPGKGGLSAA
jgi:Tfp pilus assembly protein PilO